MGETHGPKHHRTPEDLVAERKAGLRFVEYFVVAGAAVFGGIWATLVLPLFFEAPHAVGLPGTFGNGASFTAGSYELAEILGTVAFLGGALSFVGLGIWIYFRVQKDIRKILARAYPSGSE